MPAERILPVYDSVSGTEMKGAIGIAVGAASVCWEPMTGTGIFQENRASQIVDELFEIITKYANGVLKWNEMASAVEPSPPVDLNQAEMTYPTANEASPYQQLARALVFDYVVEHFDKSDQHVTFAFDEVYVVWFAKILKNWKALVSTTLPDGMYYELTFDGERGVVYLDAYKKLENREIQVTDTPKHDFEIKAQHIEPRSW